VQHEVRRLSSATGEREPEQEERSPHAWQYGPGPGHQIDNGSTAAQGHGRIGFGPVS
jgi:hypothetical protein